MRSAALRRLGEDRHSYCMGEQNDLGRAPAEIVKLHKEDSLTKVASLVKGLAGPDYHKARSAVAQ